MAGATVSLLLIIQITVIAAKNLYVDPVCGSDRNIGVHLSSPLLSFAVAVKKAKSGDHIILRKGFHYLKHQVYVDERLLITSYQNEEVHLVGGSPIPTSLFHPVSEANIFQRLSPEAQSKVKQVKLADAGIHDLGQITRFGSYMSRMAPLEISYNGSPLKLARWPNKGFVDIISVLDGRYSRRFTYSGNQPLRWKNESDMWAYGFWYFSWADLGVKIESIDTTNNIITLTNTTKFGMRKGHLSSLGTRADYKLQGGYFSVINVLAELDEPGEYYIDRTTGILYLWPPTSDGSVSATDYIYGSMLSNCITFLPQADGSILHDFTLEGCRHFGIVGYGCQNLLFQDLEIKNTGAFGIHFHADCRNITISRCSIHDGDGAISLEGGVRKTLTVSGNLVEDNHLFNFGRVSSAGQLAIRLHGVALSARYNYIHHGQGAGIRWQGNDIVMEHNHLHDTCMTSTDCGAFISGRDWTNRGNVIRSNYMHHNIRYYPGPDVRGIMLDDQTSGVLIENNVFYENYVQANIGGGRDNIIHFNFFYHSNRTILQGDIRGIHRKHTAQLLERLHAMPYTVDPWKSKYPKLANITIGDPDLPKGNKITENVMFVQKDLPDLQILGNQKYKSPEYYLLKDNFMTSNLSDFTSPSSINFHLKNKALQWAKSVNFTKLPTLKDIGSRHPTGPTYLYTGLPFINPNLPRSQVCRHTTPSSATNTPRASYLPDGSEPNTIFSVPHHGCWMIINNCTNHPSMTGTVRDTWGELNLQTATDETACLSRAAAQWKSCGYSPTQTVYAVFGPTGAMTVGGKGCYYAQYGCPKTNNYKVGIFPDNTVVKEKDCLARAVMLWKRCGSDGNFPITSIYRPTGHIRTSGSGCWIKLPMCPTHPDLKTMFYDVWGAEHLGTDGNESNCLNRAIHFWKSCGLSVHHQVTAFYRPTASSKTYPSTQKHGIQIIG